MSLVEEIITHYVADRKVSRTHFSDFLFGEETLSHVLAELEQEGLTLTGADAAALTYQMISKRLPPFSEMILDYAREVRSIASGVRREIQTGLDDRDVRRDYEKGLDRNPFITRIPKKCAEARISDKPIPLTSRAHNFCSIPPRMRTESQNIRSRLLGLSSLSDSKRNESR
jgi:hypothetical protein